ncbi:MULTISPECIES: hypothetical protein [Streptomyces]|uniref:CBS domain-containing protein n=2 Tax=Streptomyces TaxID=1883 RepID=A0ABV9ILE0_9ACTN
MGRIMPWSFSQISPSLQKSCTLFGSLPTDADFRLIEGTAESRKFVIPAEKDGQPVGVIGWNSAKAVMAAKNAYLS